LSTRIPTGLLVPEGEKKRGPDDIVDFIPPKALKRIGYVAADLVSLPFLSRTRQGTYPSQPVFCTPTQTKQKLFYNLESFYIILKRPKHTS
jgi:hypothetical protein